MLPKSIRLPHSVRLSRSNTYKAPSFLMKYSLGEQECSRFGVIISKKVDKRAVKRNYMRRLLHTFIQENLSLFPKGYDAIFIVTSLFEELPTDLTTQLKDYFKTKNL
ncbi:hypothetical protein BH09PAT1_BH09PAT1_7050 [soil metagenome]